jgi:hypothetical protein
MLGPSSRKAAGAIPADLYLAEGNALVLHWSLPLELE